MKILYNRPSGHPPKTDTQFKDKQVLVVARGNNFREDFAAIRLYVDEVKPVLVGVDGGAMYCWTLATYLM